MVTPDEFEKRCRANRRAIRRFCRREGFTIAPADSAICEEAAAKAQGYASADALRKQVAEGVNRVPFRLLGNQRWYRISDLAIDIERRYSGNSTQAEHAE